jgi:glycine betaine/proline transport system substrate-binding protein
MTGKHKMGIKLLMVALGALLILSSVIGCGATTTKTDEKGTLVFADLLWDSALFHNRVAAFILEHGYGYEIEYIPGETIPLFTGLAAGDIDISMEIWVENQLKAYLDAVAAGDVTDLGMNFPDSTQGWFVPTYMIENGDLPENVSVSDLADYWKLFEDPEDPTKGIFYAGSPGWECTGIDVEKMKAYGLDDYYNYFITGSGDTLAASMVAAYEKEEAWFGYYWKPTFIMGQLDMTQVIEPPYDEEVWATNKGMAYPADRIDIVVNSSLLDRAPEVVTFLRNYETLANMIARALVYMEENEVDHEGAAIWFLQEYEDTWTQWVPAEIADQVKDALP